METTGYKLTSKGTNLIKRAEREQSSLILPPSLRGPPVSEHELEIARLLVNLICGETGNKEYNSFLYTPGGILEERVDTASIYILEKNGYIIEDAGVEAEGFLQHERRMQERKDKGFRWRMGLDDY